MKARSAQVGTPHSPQGIPLKEPWTEQAASFIGFFVFLLVLKSFFLPLFIIPTGSMAETLYGAHAIHTCPNCGTEYPVGWQPPPGHPPGRWFHPVIQCPNCRWREYFGQPELLDKNRPHPDALLPKPLRSAAGDRIFVHGWPYMPQFAPLDGFGPQRWDVVVFKVPTDGQTNYIKRLVGLPGETLEIIEGDLFVNGQIEPKTEQAQRSLWFPYYNHDYPPKEPAGQAGYHPRWVTVNGATGWNDVASRAPHFTSDDNAAQSLRFVTDPSSSRVPGLIQDVYAYNEPLHPYHIVPDVRLSCEVDIARMDDAGFLELQITRADDRFYARLSADGRLRLQHAAGDSPTRATWGEYDAAVALRRPVRLALSHIDGQVVVEFGPERVLDAGDNYTVTMAAARSRSARRRPPALEIAAAGADLAVRHLLIERDVYYTSDGRGAHFGIEGRPITLGPDEFFLIGDNSPNSLDGRFAFAQGNGSAIGPHLRNRAQLPDEDERYHLGTVPRDQLIGQAFFVYWPGFMQLTPWGPNLLPDLGRARWIR